MSWDVVTYGVINEARSLAPVDSDERVELSALICSFIDRLFRRNQLTAIRKLIDDEVLVAKPTARKDRSVYSLIGLIRDMKSHCELITRENVFRAEEIEYDIQLIEDKANAYRNEQIARGIKTFFLPPEFSSAPSIVRHQQFDRISNTIAINRRPSDRVCVRKLEVLENSVEEACGKIYKYVNKFVAHASTPASQRSVNAHEIKVSLYDMFNAHKVLCVCAGTLGEYFFAIGRYPMLPYPQYDHLEYIDRPFADPETLPMLEQYWEERQAEIEEWSKVDFFEPEWNENSEFDV